jgi:coenzyme F420-reducing hydrogenase delta subunit
LFLVEKLTGEQFITLNYSCHQSLSKTHIIDSTSPLTNEKIYHMILVIIINVIGETMLQRALGSGWGVLLPGIFIAGLAFTDLSVHAWKAMIVLGLLLTSLMLYHKRLRHYVLLPSCAAVIAGVVLMMMNWNQG